MNDYDVIGDSVFRWWVWLSKDSGRRAMMRRRVTVLDVQLDESFYQLVRMLPNHDMDSLACVAMVVSHIDSNGNNSVATSMGRKVKGADHRVSKIRFQRILDSDLEEASRGIIRALPMIDSCADVRALGKTLYYWDNPKQYSKKKWAQDYYLADDKEVE